MVVYPNEQEYRSRAKEAVGFVKQMKRVGRINDMSEDDYVNLAHMSSVDASLIKDIVELGKTGDFDAEAIESLLEDYSRSCVNLDSIIHEGFSDVVSVRISRMAEFKERGFKGEDKVRIEIMINLNSSTFLKPKQIASITSLPLPFVEDFNRLKVIGGSHHSLYLAGELYYAVGYSLKKEEVIYE